MNQIDISFMVLARVLRERAARDLELVQTTNGRLGEGGYLYVLGRSQTLTVVAEAIETMVRGRPPEATP